MLQPAGSDTFRESDSTEVFSFIFPDNEFLPGRILTSA